jgi:hypothetical protein
MRGGDAIIAFNRAVGNSNAIKAPFPGRSAQAL